METVIIGSAVIANLAIMLLVIARQNAIGRALAKLIVEIRGGH